MAPVASVRNRKRPTLLAYIVGFPGRLKTVEKTEMGRFQHGNSAAKGHGRPAGSGFSSQLREVVGKEQFKALV